MSEAEIRLTADTTAARKEVSSFRKEYADMVRAVEKPMAQVDAFRGVQESAKAASAEFFAAKKQVAALKAAMAQAGQPVKELDRELVKAERSLAKATAEFDRQKSRVREQRTELRAAGVDTRNLANEQQRLQAEMAKALSAGRNDNAISGIRARTAEIQRQAVAQRQANLESAQQNLGVGRYRQLEAQLVSVRQQYQLLRVNGSLTGKELAVAQQQVTNRIRETQAEMRELAGLQGASGGARFGMASIAGAAAGAYSGLAAIRTYMQMADAVRQIDAKLRLATASQEEFNVASKEVRRIADENGSAISAVTQLYSRLAPSLRESGRSQTDIIKVVEAVSKTMRISGASAAESEGAIVQFAQALGSGALRGDEFNSVAEAAPRLMKALADGLGVPTTALRDMAKAGQLTAGVVTDALIGQLPQLEKEAEALGETFELSAQRMSNAALDAVGAVDKLTGTSGRTAEALTGIAAGINQISNNEKPLQGVVTALQSILALTAQGALAKAFADQLVKRLGAAPDKTAEEALAAAKKYQIQMDMLAKEQIDRDIRRLAEEQKTAAKSKGIKFDEVQSLSAWASAMGTTYDDFIAREEERSKLRAQGVRSGNDMVATARREELESLQVQLKSRDKVLADENKRLEAARSKTLEIEREFNSIIADIRAGASGKGSSYLDAQDALLSSQRAKASGDTKFAIDEARRGAQILKDLAAAGENSYGFEYLAAQLKEVAVGASQIDADKVKAEVEQVKSHYDDLAKQVEALKVVSIELGLEDSSVEALKMRMRAIAAELARVMVIRPTIVPPDFSTPYTLQEPPGFAAGGRIRGPGTGTSDSILARLSDGEFVMRAAAVRHYGPELLERLNQMRLPRFATGGQVGRALPAIPAPSQALLDAGRAPEIPHLGSMDISIGGSAPVTVQGTPDALRELSIAARKFGRTHR